MAPNRIHVIAVLMASAAGVLATVPASASDRQVYQFDLPAQNLGDALRTVAAKAGLELYARADDVNNIPAARLQARMTAREAIERLLAGTNLRARFDKGAVIIRGRPTQKSESDSAAQTDIVVTGSRIQGGKVAAPVTTVTSADIRKAGHADLGEVMRSLPLNFAGGQSPGIGTDQGSANTNVNGASSVNLLGLGPNATLTLLDGNRLSYTGVNAAVDISAIPVAAVDRIEIVADGASAIYGADAVAGVVNVRLRRDYNGASVMGRIGGATDGGGFQQQYNIVGGRKWTSGGILATYDYLSNNPVFASQRIYAAKMASDATLYPALTRHSALVSLNQDVGDLVSFTIDSLYKNSRQQIIQGFVSGQSHFASGADALAKTTTFSIAPNATVKLGGDWLARLVTAYARDDTDIASNVYSAGAIISAGTRRYKNSSISIELGAQGSIGELPAGPLRAAFGLGYRDVGLNLVGTNAGITLQKFSKHRDNRFAYGELYFPILSPNQRSRFGRELSFSAAFRYEENGGTGSVALPKIGVIYSPVGGLTLKGSWGRSFRLPTLYQQYSGYAAVLDPATSYGTGLPTGATVLWLGGAGPNMKPERSENWTISAEIKPAALDALSATFSYFNFDYTNRVATPISSSAGILDNPIYSSLVTLSPTAALLQAEISGATVGLQNAAGQPYDPADVVALVDTRDRNVARQNFHGINLAVRYLARLPHNRSLDFTLDGTWIASDQQLLAGLPYVDLAGTIFNPPHLRARAGVSYSTDMLSLSGYANLSSHLTDNRTAAVAEFAGPSTFDLSAQFKGGNGFELGATISNLFNQKPKTIVTASAYQTPFDTTNYSPLGRFVSVSVRKSW
ncbi:TonB-dependent receptor-like protein [Hephaestia caeni]|jgi:outer membrane receptor protein involved in Fe transport|uniref:TonB-dependent receptor-like protein n=1 Tax=Hephaestia caeni TaxID=645617 RepID=A0A397PAW8_9SPHN|nr:TonB-dependent receptor [Hephaestia caeni]RIA44297.1 TonB-dependent receptor-like protein [Hephaestia caeni]